MTVTMLIAFGDYLSHGSHRIRYGLYEERIYCRVSRSDWEKCKPLEVFHGGVDVPEGEVRERVIRRDLERLCEYVSSVVGAVHAV